MIFRAEHDIQDGRIKIPRRDLYPSANDSRFSAGLARMTVYLASEISPDELEQGEYISRLDYRYSGNVNHTGVIKYSTDGYIRKLTELQAQVGTSMSPAFFEHLLQNVYDDPDLQLGHILTGVGFTDPARKPYQIFGIAK